MWLYHNAKEKENEINSLITALVKHFFLFQINGKNDLNMNQLFKKQKKECISDSVLWIKYQKILRPLIT